MLQLASRNISTKPVCTAATRRVKQPGSHRLTRGRTTPLRSLDEDISKYARRVVPRFFRPSTYTIATPNINYSRHAVRWYSTNPSSARRRLQLLQSAERERKKREKLLSRNPTEVECAKLVQKLVFDQILYKLHQLISSQLVVDKEALGFDLKSFPLAVSPSLLDILDISSSSYLTRLNGTSDGNSSGSAFGSSYERPDSVLNTIGFALLYETNQVTETYVELLARAIAKQHGASFVDLDVRYLHSRQLSPFGKLSPDELFFIKQLFNTRRMDPDYITDRATKRRVTLKDFMNLDPDLRKQFANSDPALQATLSQEFIADILAIYKQLLTQHRLSWYDLTDEREPRHSKKYGYVLKDVLGRWKNSATDDIIQKIHSSLLKEVMQTLAKHFPDFNFTNALARADALDLKLELKKSKKKKKRSIEQLSTTDYASDFKVEQSTQAQDAEKEVATEEINNEDLEATEDKPSNSNSYSKSSLSMEQVWSCLVLSLLHTAAQYPELPPRVVYIRDAAMLRSDYFGYLHRLRVNFKRHLPILFIASVATTPPKAKSRDLMPRLPDFSDTLEEEELDIDADYDHGYWKSLNALEVFSQLLEVTPTAKDPSEHPNGNIWFPQHESLLRRDTCLRNCARIFHWIDDVELDAQSNSPVLLYDVAVGENKINMSLSVPPFREKSVEIIAQLQEPAQALLSRKLFTPAEISQIAMWTLSFAHKRASGSNRSQVTVNAEDFNQALNLFANHKGGEVELESNLAQTSPGKAKSIATAARAGASLRAKLDQIMPTLNQFERRLVSSVADPSTISTTFHDIGALDDTKRRLELLFAPFRLRRIFQKSHSSSLIKVPSGVLLYGPPGTGKTMLCRALARHAVASLLHISASNIHEMWFGNSEKNVAAMFSLAKKLSPAIIFVDEADAVLGKRQNERADISVKTEFMAQWDGMLSNNENRSIVIICATNRPYALDPAVLRRLPHRILVDLPNMESRKKILEKMLANVRLDVSTLPNPGKTVSAASAAAAAVAAKTVDNPTQAEAPQATNVSTASDSTDASPTTEVVDIVQEQPAEDPKLRDEFITRLAEMTNYYSGSDLQNVCFTAAQSIVNDIINDKEYDADSTNEQLVAIAKKYVDRPLRWQDFMKALEDVKPSVTEEGALKELREWQKTFGEKRGGIGF